MKKHFSLILIVLFCSTVLFANGVKIGGIYYNLNTTNMIAEVTFMPKGKYSGNISIPASVKYRSVTYRVTGIGWKAFHNCTGLTSVTIPNSVINSIGRAAFYGCDHLTTINVVADNPIYCSVDGVLFNKDQTMLVEYPKGRKGGYTIPNNVKIIGKRAFSYCRGLTSVTIPNSVTSVSDSAFCECTSLWRVIIGDNVKNIGKRAFFKCASLTSVSIGNSVKSIGNGVFSYCRGLTSVTIPNSVTHIGENAFYYCSNLTSVAIPNSVTSIEKSTFSGCTNLTSVSIGNSVKSIGGWAFSNCTSLKSVVIPSSVTTIEKNAFLGCNYLKEISYPKGLDLSQAEIAKHAKLIAYNVTNSSQLQTNTSLPPILAFVSGSLVFLDDNKNNMINADEQCKIRFKISNNGKGAGEDCVARISLSGDNKGISVKDVKLPSIPAGKTVEVTIPITSDLNTQNGKVTFSIEVYEPNGFGVAPFDLTVATKAYEAPLLQVVDYNIASTSGKIKKMEPFTLSFNLQNTKYGTAEDVRVKLNLPAGVFVMDDNTEQRYTQIKSGEVRKVSYTLIANNNYPTTNIPITIDIKEKHGKFAENKQLNIALNQTASSTINIAANDEPQQERKEIQLAMMTAEVDRDIPVVSTKNGNTFVLIIANENYQSVASVPYALNDGKIFRQYCEQTLGVPAKNIHEVTNATGNQIKAQINWLQNVVEVFDNPNVIFYYAGHGIPDESSKTAYLLPVDGSGTDVSTGYKLDDLYTTLGKMPASHITVFMDACFSGSKREEGMLASARGVALKTKSGVPQGNMVVFSAAQGNETAYPNKEKQHGMFTYYLLKKLQDTKGEVSLQELGDYIITNVKQQSILQNSKLQTPCVTPSSSLGSDWQNWKLK